MLFVFFVLGLMQDEENLPLFPLVFYSTQLVGIPFWMRASRSLGKHRT